MMSNSSCLKHCDYLKAAHNLFEKAAVNKDCLSGLNVWIGASRHDKISVQMKNLYACVLEKLGINLLDEDFEAILENRIAYDVILMFTFTPGSSARAIELVITNEFKENKATEKLHIYMPSEYTNGYIFRKLSNHILAGRIFPRKNIKAFERLEADIFCKCIGHLVDVANDRKREMEMTFKPTIAIITALPHEFDMVKHFMSNIRLDKSFKNSANQYPHGRIGNNDVVLAMTGKGNNLAAAISTKVLEKYPSVTYTFVVGIAGGIPDFSNPDNSVRLGDIVICDEQGILQYDMCKSTKNGTEYNFSPRAPHAELFRSIQIYSLPLNDKEYKYWEYLDDISNSKNIERPEEEVLDESVWIEDLTIGTQAVLPKREDGRPRLHFGSICSSNTLLKNIDVRNNLKDNFGAKAVEMEASGISDATWLEGKYCIVIRGICDYANPEKNDVWQQYAAAVAAAFTCEYIEANLNADAC